MAELSSADVTSRVVRHGELGGRAPDHMGIVTSRASAPLWGEVADYVLARAPSP
jgi:hypothetical protein